MKSSKKRDNLCIIASMGSFIGNFLALHSEALNKNGRLDLICCDGKTDLIRGLPGNIMCVPLNRYPTPLRDFFFYQACS